MKVTIAIMDHEFSLEISKQDSVLHIKHKIQQILGASVQSQTLSVLDWELIDGLDMEDYPIITEGTKINLILKSFEFDYSKIYDKFPLIIQHSSRNIKINVDVTDTVRILKEKIHIIDGMPLKKMVLYFCGKELDDEFRSLTEYGVKEFSEITVNTKSDHLYKRLSVVVQTSSALLNSARFVLDVRDSSGISELKQILLFREILPFDDYIFIHKQRIMLDKLSLKCHGVENGDFIYVFKGSISNDKY